MALADVRKTVLELINTVRKKQGLSEVSSLTADAQSKVMVDLLNDVVAETASYGDWIELVATAQLTAVSGQASYSFASAAVVESINEVYFQGRTGRLNTRSLEEMRLLSRSSASGTPSQFAIMGTDANANPILAFNPRPGASEAGKLFEVFYYTKPPVYTTSSGSTVVPFPANVLEAGLQAACILDEEGGAQTPQYETTYGKYLFLRKEAFNRYRAKTGFEIRARPLRPRRGRR